jgi:hypothetical protein
VRSSHLPEGAEVGYALGKKKLEFFQKLNQFLLLLERNILVSIGDPSDGGRRVVVQLGSGRRR